MKFNETSKAFKKDQRICWRNHTVGASNDGFQYEISIVATVLCNDPSEDWFEVQKTENLFLLRECGETSVMEDPSVAGEVVCWFHNADCQYELLDF